MVTVDDVRQIVAPLPRSYEVVVRDRIKFRIGQIVYLAFSRDETVMGFAFPKEERAGLVETDFGGWEGLTFAEARERDPELHAAWLGDERAAPPGGESFATVGVRVAAVRASVVAEYPAQTVVVVSHVTPIKLLLRQALAGGPEILYRLHLDLASLSVADFYRDGGASVRLFNDTTHVPRP